MRTLHNLEILIITGESRIRYLMELEKLLIRASDMQFYFVLLRKITVRKIRDLLQSCRDHGLGPYQKMRTCGRGRPTRASQCNSTVFVAARARAPLQDLRTPRRRLTRRPHRPQHVPMSW